MITATRTTLRRLCSNASGVAMTEFAVSLPFVLGVGLLGLETANRALVQMQVSQIAVHIADNASRIGEQSMLQDRKIYEADINDLFYGAYLQGGAGIDLYEHGRVVLSSLEVVPGSEDDQNYIHWQRCMGTKDHQSSYGDEGDGLGSGISGMGPPGEEVFAFAEEAVMFVEISYDYQPIVGAPFSYDSDVISVIASFTVRDDRDLSQIYQRDEGNPDPVANCNAFGGSSYSTSE